MALPVPEILYKYKWFLHPKKCSLNSHFINHMACVIALLPQFIDIYPALNNFHFSALEIHLLVLILTPVTIVLPADVAVRDSEKSRAGIS